uniref:Rotatin n=1 Tax=Nothobranchius pienaari TaxID=704102 RepID=A0A1A8MUL0_9TELE
MELSPLIKKIGHSLVEIRVRALKSILCKLDLSLISVDDIVQEKMLFVYLLEWFNFPEVPMKEEVLELLSTLSKNPGAAQMLRDVGAVDFLTQLSPTMEPRLRAVIDGALDQLFQLPELLPSQSAVYSHGPRSTTTTAPTIVSPEDNLPKMGYFHKNTDSSRDVPPQKIAVHESANDNLPENTATALFHLCLDASLGNLLPSMQETAVAYLEQVNSDRHDTYRRVIRAATWMESTCNFLKEVKAEGEKNWLELLELADQAIDGLPFHKHLPIIKECIHMVSYLVLYEISTFGLQDSAEKVNTAAKDILLFLLKGRLMMTASAWDRFNEALYLVVPILQGYASTEESLGKCVLLISDMSDVAGDDVPTSTAKLKAALRLLFTKQPTVRVAAVQQVLPHLTSSGDAKTSRPDVDQSVIASLPNLFCLRNPVDVTLDTRKSILKVESVEKLFGILHTDTSDVSLRRSAAEQLCVVLQDTTMHPVLKNLGLPDEVLSLITECVSGNESFDCLLESCVCILRKLVYADPSLRRSLAQRSPPLLALLRASLILKENQGNGSEGAVLMSLLLFDEIASIQMWTASGPSPLQRGTGTISECVNEKFADHLLHTATLQFLSTVFTEETKRRSVEVTNSTSKRDSGLSEILNEASASQLCELLLQSFERRTPQDPLKKLTARAMMTLLACSPTAQNYAAKVGLIDSCVEQLRQTQSQLHLESLRPGRTSHRRKEGGCLKEVRLAAEMLQSTLYNNNECKVAATDARLTQTLYALWPWLLLDDPTMEVVLELLCVYTANCPPACSSLCSSVPGGVPGSKGSLMHSVMKLTSLTADCSAVQSLAFSLLVNLTVSRDCRCILQKNNFLQAFLLVPAPKAAGAKATSGATSPLSLWLRLLVSLSSTEDGQQSILKVTGALELLADLAPHRRHALLTLHNLCFCPANKSHVISNENSIKVLMSCLESREMETCCMGASALWALLHNNQRAKTALKCPSVQLKIKEALSTFKTDAEKKQDPLSVYLLKCLKQLSLLLLNV